MIINEVCGAKPLPPKTNKQTDSFDFSFKLNIEIITMATTTACTRIPPKHVKRAGARATSSEVWGGTQKCALFTKTPPNEGNLRNPELGDIVSGIPKGSQLTLCN